MKFQVRPDIDFFDDHYRKSFASDGLLMKGNISIAAKSAIIGLSYFCRAGHFTKSQAAQIIWGRSEETPEDCEAIIDELIAAGLIVPAIDGSVDENEGLFGDIR
jgi:hypothetical protein